MASNFFGNVFRITTFGESHGVAIGVVIDGCPAGVSLAAEDVDRELARRRPGQNQYVTPRKEMDMSEIVSGVFEGQTTGAPIAILIRNRDADSSQYASMREVYRPGHANFTYLEKYGIFDYRGGGRASARETAARVAAGAVAKKMLQVFDVDCVAFLSEVGTIEVVANTSDLIALRKGIDQSPIFCPDLEAEAKILQAIVQVKEEGDSLGGILGCVAKIPRGLGDPVFGKLEAMLASAMLSLPASKGFEIGAGFQAARMKGSEHNDLFDVRSDGSVSPATNFSGGTLGGISTGAPLFFRVAFKPTSTILQPQQTATLRGEKAILQPPKTARHDPCVAIRAVPIVEAMTALVLADCLLMGRIARI